MFIVDLLIKLVLLFLAFLAVWLVEDPLNAVLLRDLGVVDEGYTRLAAEDVQVLDLLGRTPVTHSSNSSQPQLVLSVGLVHGGRRYLQVLVRLSSVVLLDHILLVLQELSVYRYTPSYGLLRLLRSGLRIQVRSRP